MGRLLGLERGALLDLGFAALYHDIGRAPGFRQASADGGSEDERSLATHIAKSVSIALRGHGYDDAGLLRIVVAHEHHLQADGYPKGEVLHPLHALSRIVAVADAFDKLEHGAPWAAAVGPAAALKWLEAEPKRYDATAVGLLREVLGRTPRGQLLELKDNSVVVVVDGGAHHGKRAIARRLDDAGTLLEVDKSKVASELAPGDVKQDWRKVLVK